MRRHILYVLLIGSLFGIGCATSRTHRPYPPDPLLLRKRPIEASADAAVPQTVAQAEPLPPTAPTLAVAAAESSPVSTESTVTQTQPASVPEFRTAERSPIPLQAQPAVNSSNTPVAATPTNRPKESVVVSTTPAIRRQVPEMFGNAPDYGWLQGTLEKHHSGHWELRYCDPSREDKHGGKVAFADDPRLAAFTAGDLILVEGEIVAEQGNRSAWRHFPQYRVREIWLAQVKAAK